MPCFVNEFGRCLIKFGKLWEKIVGNSIEAGNSTMRFRFLITYADNVTQGMFVGLSFIAI